VAQLTLTQTPEFMLEELSDDVALFGPVAEQGILNPAVNLPTTRP
jgi:hypothetical protein